MRHLALTLLLSIGLAHLAACSHEPAAAASSSPPIAVQARQVEASCGECQFGMSGKSCDLAVRIDGKAYFVDGTGLNDHGDSHAADGFCNAVRQARVSGQIQGERFVASSFELLPAAQ